MDNKEEMNEQKDRKTDKKKRQEKRLCLSILAYLGTMILMTRHQKATTSFTVNQAKKIKKYVKSGILYI